MKAICFYHPNGGVTTRVINILYSYNIIISSNKLMTIRLTNIQ